jgi:hypothetical protein
MWYLYYELRALCRALLQFSVLGSERAVRVRSLINTTTWLSWQWSVVTVVVVDTVNVFTSFPWNAKGETCWPTGKPDGWWRMTTGKPADDRKHVTEIVTSHILSTSLVSPCLGTKDKLSRSIKVFHWLYCSGCDACSFRSTLAQEVSVLILFV